MGQIRAVDTRIIPHRRGFSADANPLNAKTRERSGLAGDNALPAGFMRVLLDRPPAAREVLRNPQLGASEVELVLEIRAKNQQGFDGSTRRTVSENARHLKAQSSEFD